MMGMGRILPLRRVQGEVAEMSDEALLAACALPDAAALGALFDRFAPAVSKFLMRFLGSAHAEVDDLVQATFLEAQRCAGSFRGKSTVRAWILGISANLARHHLRGETRRRNMLSVAAVQPTTPHGRPDDDSERRQMLARLHEAITELPPELRAPLVLCDMEELPGAEAARVLDLREGTLWRRLHEARKLLREKMERSAR
jgi:RNA polymerase sigma-70 factor (ECF subfamily)